MTFLRHASRHVLHTVSNSVETGMAGLSWTVPGSVPFGSPVVEFKHVSAWAEGSITSDVKAGLVSVSLGSEFDPDEEELGGPLSSQEYPIFFDVFMDKEATALALANDIRDWLLGRFSGSKRHIPVVNQATGDPVEGWLLELDDVERVRPDSVMALHWQVVKVTALAFFPEEQY